MNAEDLVPAMGAVIKGVGDQLELKDSVQLAIFFKVLLTDSFQVVHYDPTDRQILHISLQGRNNDVNVENDDGLEMVRVKVHFFPNKELADAEVGKHQELVASGLMPLYVYKSSEVESTYEILLCNSDH